MGTSHALLHALQIFGVFACVHHFYPKGITYGEKEEWEREQKRKSRGMGHRRRGESGRRSRREFEEDDYYETYGRGDGGYGYGRGDGRDYDDVLYTRRGTR
ncbi:hypothetical protein GLAREA_04534 [Glarea lozoyensis ATCC 20868]|uniref:Uncharacterized protein n=1 Tax=Glarea lozoyensis (strain ATCC 20868 / MF5171) TaxID=1116229 RepID=S3DML5_GLAL2|nr:uncharacterized protein GLAREA_04534 [Glarea lozoyensis ATCC 20868]EPE27743.1 hypothetical protein GLAREA_04534 [Glarea lozoyensis ATCC 20868]